jgi:arylsulfatase A-like enzyme
VFWSFAPPGRKLAARLPLPAIRAGAAALAGALALAAARIPESSPTYQAVGDASLGLRAALRIARRLADGDGDGYAARFGGGDCDDRSAEVHPGAEDLAGDGVDQDCEDGDAKPSGEPRKPPPKPDGQPPKPPAAQGRFQGNLLIITIDALRADRTAAGGNSEELTPNLDALARAGVVFTRAHAHAPNTPRSFPATLLSRPPSLVGWGNAQLNYPDLKPGQRSFFDGLKDVGFQNVGVFSHHYFKPERGLHGAFAEWTNDGAKTIKDSNEDIASPRIVPRVIERLQKLGASKQRFAIWTHLFEPHSKYVDHAEFPVSIGGLPGLVKRYDSEVRYVDQWVGKLVKAVEDAGLRATTAIVIFADHGEAFGEHNRKYFHGEHIYEEVLRVPLIIKVPGMAARKVEELVGLGDLGPTLLELVGAPPESTFRGQSLVPLMLGEAATPRTHVAELMPQTSFKEHHRVLLDGNWKLYQRVTDNTYELYDLGKDPGEKQNLAAKEPARVAELKQKLQRELSSAR